MTSSLPPSTQHRLQLLPQIPNVWEGDRRPFSGGNLLDPEQGEGGECILWVDGSEGLVRSMEIIPESAGMETIVRALIRAMELPRSPAPPCRPKKIIVRNRELQFLLRGILQGLDIVVDYQPHLPLIDELFRTFESADEQRPSPVPESFNDLLKKLAKEIWQLAPWEVLADLDIISIEMPSLEELPTLYACVMGMLGEEYGIILYRSLESLRKFREMAMAEDISQSPEQIFLSQDCWFINYELEGTGVTEETSHGFLSAGESNSPGPLAIFGSIHPLEGIRPFIDEEEALAIYCALEALARFVSDNYSALEEEEVSNISQTFKIKHPLKSHVAKDHIAVNLSTQPELTEDFLTAVLGFDTDDEENVFKDDLIPENSYMSLGMVPWELAERIRLTPSIHYQPSKFREKGDGMPVLMIQTSRPKAKDLIQRLHEEGGIAGLGFNVGEDPWMEIEYDLGVLKTGMDSLFLFGEFLRDSPTHRQARKNWERRCKDTKGHCAVLIAMGITGKAKGSPELKHMLAYFETKFLTSEELGLGTLKMSTGLDFDL